MATLSYNETKTKQLKLRHIFLPSAYGFTCEVVIGVVALLVFNASQLSNQLLTKNFDDADPLPLWNHFFTNILDRLQNLPGVQQMLLFLLWAMVGALLYVLAFRTFQAVFGVKRSVGIGVRFMRQEHTKGLLHWLASLHDFFLTSIIFTLGTAALIFGSLVCFSLASQELRNGLTAGFPDSIQHLLISLIAAVLSVRLIALGLSLLSSRFRNWYTT